MRGSYGKAVDPDTKQLRYTSVSSVTTFSPDQYGGCPRAWWYEKIGGRERPKTAALGTGSDVHAEIEHYEKTGEDTLGIIARQGKHFIPAPGPGLLIEHEFGGDGVVQAFEHWRAIRDAGQADTEWGRAWRAANIPVSALEATDVPFVGFIDVVNLRPHWVDTEGTLRDMPAKSVELLDWKTSSNIELYGKTDLAATVQMIGYAEWARRQWPGLEYFRLSHGYFQTRGRAAEKRTVLISLDTVQERWKGIEEQVKRMAQVARETDVNRIEPNYESCNAFGRLGCPHKEVCPRDPQKSLIDLLGGKNAMNMLEMMNSLNGAAAVPGPAAATPTAAVVAPTSSIATPSGGNMLDMLRAMGAAPSTPVSAVPAPVAAAQPAPSSAGVEAAKAAFLAAEQPTIAPRANISHGTILKHKERGYRVRFLTENGLWYFQNVNLDGSCSAPSSTTLEVWPASAWDDVTALPATGIPSILPPDAPASNPATAAQPIPPGTALSPAVAAAAAAHAQAAGAASAEAPPAEAPKKTRTKKADDAGAAATAAVTATAPVLSPGALLLFVDCTAKLPGLDVVDLGVYVANVCAAMAKATGLEDIRLGSSENVLGFGKWKGVLAAAVRAAPPTGACSIRVEGDEIKQVVLATLLPLATGGVVRGVR